NKSDQWFVSKKGYRLRPLKSGATRLALQTNCDVLPVWVKGAERVMPLGSRLPKFWRRVDVRIGSIFRLEGEDNKENSIKGTVEFTKILLDLADED
ncbi:MAG: hypothetical protein Q8N57_00920, partial [bacterium]|nr:hypothetical protein [bacterium]